MNKVAEQDSLELKSCPFCGSSEVIIHKYAGGRAGVKCRNCFCLTPLCFSRDEAIAAWNARPEADTLSQMRDVLTDAREAIASLEDGALGWVFSAAGDQRIRWPITSELLAKIDTALTTTKIEKE